ncbi:MAG: hypothetical protein RL220_844, partial [Bacteroidota bacterium]
WKYDNDQRAFEGEFTGGLPSGKHRYWYRNGNVKMKGGYEGGEMEGSWQYYDESGIIILDVEYRAGEAVAINGRKIKLPKSEAAENE